MAAVHVDSTCLSPLTSSHPRQRKGMRTVQRSNSQGRKLSNKETVS